MKFEPKARWIGAPPICIKENLPALESEEALKVFLEMNGLRCFVLERYKCDWCGYWHAKTLAPDPSGSSSGTTRTSRRLAS